MSKLGWVDFSSEDRELVRKVMAMMREPGTLDELGIGQIRDAFADLLFPGISTIQTRAKYFITVPRILRDYYESRSNSKRRKHEPLQAFLKNHENEVAKILIKLHGSQETGIIGSTQVDSGGVARRPSSVYWNGLRQFGIINTQSSLAEFCRSYGDTTFLGEGTEHECGQDDIHHFKTTQPVHLPKGSNSQWRSELSINLTRAEAKFLENKIRNARGIEHSVIAQLYLNRLAHDALQLNDGEPSSFNQLQNLLINHAEVSALCKKRLVAAEQFSFAMVGPHLRYNIILARKNGFQNRVEQYETDYQDWRQVAQYAFEPEDVDIWLNIAEIYYLKPATKVFLQRFLADVSSGRDESVLDEQVSKQALNNKKQRSLLNKRLTHDGWVGIKRLDYRWSAAQPIIRDIQRGLEC